MNHPQSSPNAPTGLPYLLSLWDKAREDLCGAGLLRSLPTSGDLPDTSLSGWDKHFDQSASEAVAKLMTAELADPLNLNTNDYLGLQRSGVTQTFDSELARQLPLGGLSSRLVGGDHPMIRMLEAMFAQMMGAERALYFSSGMVLNMAIPSFFSRLERQACPQAPPGLVFLSDALNHASTIEGMGHRSLQAYPKVIFDHLALKDLTVASYDVRCCLLFLEGLYSMDGDSPSRTALCKLLAQKVVVVMDEAHSFGVMEQGSYVDSLDHQHRQSLLGVYPMGKAMGCSGALLTGPGKLMEAVINLSRPFIYSTATSPLMAGALILRLKMHGLLGPLREKLRKISVNLADELEDIGYEVRGHGGPFICVMLGSAERSMQVSQLLAQRGIQVTAIRYPTVPKGHSRLRLSLHPFLSQQHQDTITQAFQAAYVKIPN